MKYFGLIKGRHDLPCEEYIFDGDIENVLDFQSLENHIKEFLKKNVGWHEGTDVAPNAINFDSEEFCWVGNEPIEVYVTGLTPVTSSLIKVCLKYGIRLALLHYDRDSGEYKRQQIC